MYKVGGKSILNHFATISLGTIINVIVGLISVPIITRLVLPSDYGDYSLFTMYADIAVMVICCGMDQSLVRFYYTRDYYSYKSALLRTCLILPVILFIITVVLYYIIEGFTDISFGFSGLITGLLFFYILLQVFNRFSFLTVRLQYDSRLFASLNVINKALFAILAIVFLLSINSHDLLVLCGSTVIAILVVTVWGIYKEKSIWFGNIKEFNKIDYRQIIKYGTPFVFSLGIATLFHSIDKIALNYYCGSAEVGIYSGALNLIKVFTIVQTTFNSLWSPMAMESYEKNPENKSLFIKANDYITIIMFFIGLLLIVGKDLFALFLGIEYRSAANIFPCLVFFPIMYTISETTCLGIDFSKKSYLHVWVAIGACLTNIIGNVILVPIMAGKGAAISTGISYIVFFTLRTFLARKQYYVDYKLVRIFIFTALTLLYALINTFFEFGTITILGFIICVLCLYLFYRNEIKSLVFETFKQIKI